nr:hypothetical protein [Snodgrassella alvi]
MIGNYLKEPDKYLYGVFVSGDPGNNKKYVHCSIEEAIFFVRDILIYHTHENITVYIYRREQIVPSECSSISTYKIINLLETSDRDLSEKKNIIITNNKMPLMFSKLSYEKIKELRNIIDVFLDKNIKTAGVYKIGELVEKVTLTKDEYIKYL